MFGLKIRSWMENHIRPRKKGNKNKNGNSGNLVTSINNTHNGHKGISSNQPDSSIVGSPARRSEVSPIQNHTTSRFGWQTPDDDDFNKIDPNYPYMVKSSTNSPRPMSSTINRNSKTSSHESAYSSLDSTYAPYTKSCDTKYSARSIEIYHHTTNQSRDNSAVLRAITSSSSSTIASPLLCSPKLSTAHNHRNRNNKYPSHSSHDYESHKMFEHQTQSTTGDNTQPQKMSFTKYERIYNSNNDRCLANNGADDSDNFQNIMITINDVNDSNNCINYIDDCSTNQMDTPKKHINTNKTKNNQQTAMLQNYHHNTKPHDYQNDSNQIADSFYDKQMHYHYANVERQQQTQHIKSSNRKQITKNIVNNNELMNDERDSVAQRNGKHSHLHDNQYGKILNCNNRLGQITKSDKDHQVHARNAAPPIPRFPSPPSTPPPLTTSRAKIKDYPTNIQHQQNSRFNGNANSVNNNNLNEMILIQNNHLSSSSSSNNNNNNNNNASSHGFEFYSNGCSHATASHENSINNHKESVQNRTANKQAHARTNGVYHHTNGINGSTHLTQAAGKHHQLPAHVINSLSSPESAYSTGYSSSCDGTSPGTTNAPEYYINMRTGTHYFPRGVNAVAAVERSRQKFGLNKIEETAGESLCATPQTATTTTTTTTTTSSSSAPTNHGAVSNHRRTESFDLSHRRQSATFLSGSNCNGIGAPILPKDMCNLMQTNTQSRMSPDLQRHLALQTYKGFESPSPRQRCRIKTNPWFSTSDATSTSSNGNSIMKKMDIDTSSTSSGIKSSSDAGTDDKQRKNHILSESDDSTSTEIEVSRKSFSPNTIRKRKLDKQLSERLSYRNDSEDDDATFNELMGKFDESYIYEKETDILSDDSDPTECGSDLDTGQDGGDECETDELLDIDYIDTGSIQEVTDKDIYKNTGSCTYHHDNQGQDKRQTKLRKSRKQQSEENNGSRRRKRLTRTRKRNSECRDGSQTSRKTNSPIQLRESRSVGGTPVSLRRNRSENRHRSTSKMVPLSSRCNSLTFTEIHSIRSRFLAIAESEKALLKADIEADVKYKQLIHEAETILVSMKTTALRETPVPSPSRRICNLPANKRVEMLRNCEADLRSKNQLKSNSAEQDVVINRKESHELLVIPSSPVPVHDLPKITYANGNGGRFSPRKTHITNFINQNIAPSEMLRQSTPEPQIASHPTSIEYYESKMKRSPCLQFNTVRNKITPTKSPMPRRRFRSQSPRICIEESDSDSDTLNANRMNFVAGKKLSAAPKRNEINGGKENQLKYSWRKSKSPVVVKDDLINENAIAVEECAEHGCPDVTDNRPFRSIDMAHRYAETYYCPQSEPLKRKIYSEKTLDRLQKSLDMESEIPKKALLQKISNLRRDRQQQYQTVRTSHSLDDTENHQTQHTLNGLHNASENDIAMFHKRQLILNTIEDLKRNLEDQSIELSGLNDDED